MPSSQLKSKSDFVIPGEAQLHQNIFGKTTEVVGVGGRGREGGGLIIIERKKFYNCKDFSNNVLVPF